MKETIYIKRSVKEKLPEKTDIYLTNLGEIKWINDHRSFLGFWQGKPDIKYWLEEMSLEEYLKEIKYEQTKNNTK